MTKFKEPKSKEGAERQAWSIVNSYLRDFAGGGAFGWDWPTFRVNSPERYARVQELRELYKVLPSRRA